MTGSWRFRSASPQMVKPLNMAPPVPLFLTHVGGALQGITGPQYVVSSDGQRFLMNTVNDEATTSPITVILNRKSKP